MTCFTETWGATITDQRDYISKLFLVMAEVESNLSAVQVYQPTEPTSSDLVDAFKAAFPNLGGSPSPGCTFLWVNSGDNVVQSIYKTVDDIADLVSSGTIFGYREKDLSLDFVFLGEDSATTDAATGLNVQNLPYGSYSHYFMTYNARSVDAAISSTFGVRVNGIVAANYGAQTINISNTVVATIASPVASINSATWMSGAQTTQPSIALAGFGIAFNVARLYAYLYLRHTHYYGNVSPIAVANRFFGILWGIEYIALANGVSSIQITGPTNFKRNSRLCVWGMK